MPAALRDQTLALMVLGRAPTLGDVFVFEPVDPDAVTVTVKIPSNYNVAPEVWTAKLVPCATSASGPPTTPRGKGRGARKGRHSF